MTPETVLEVRDLRVRFGIAIDAVRGVSLDVRAGETHCLVGESGCGKSVTALAIMGLLSRGAVRSAGRLAFRGTDMARLSEGGMAKLRGDKIAMIFQEPMTSLNPAFTIGSQMAEVFERHRGGGRRIALDRAAGLLGRVGVSAPGLRLAQYPHQLSGGLRQRVMIAMALMCDPELLIADEPTTALDVTVQAQILRLLVELQRDLGLAILLITHDLGVVANMCDRVVVMYGGRVLETGTVDEIFTEPTQPYTQGLLHSIPRLDDPRGMELTPIPGNPPDMLHPLAGCPFAPRCPHVIARCPGEMPPLEELGTPTHRAACWVTVGDRGGYREPATQTTGGARG